MAMEGLKMVGQPYRAVEIEPSYSTPLENTINPKWESDVVAESP